MRCRFSSLIVILLTLFTMNTVRAGNGPQNVLVVVNAASAESLEIGNAYRRARNIPYRQLFTIKTTTTYAIPYQTYLDEIETPIQTYLKSQQLEEEVTCIVLTRGIPQQVLVDNGRSTASLLATMNMKKDDKPAYARCSNPYYNISIAFAPRAESRQGMYLVTVLNGYHTRDIERMIAQGVAADGTAPAGQFLLQTSSNFTASVYTKINDLLTERSLSANVVNTPPSKADGLMGYFSGGIYSGLTPEVVTSCTFRPGAIADIAQSFSAAANNFDESTLPILLPLGAFVRAGVSGVHGVVGEAGINAFPLTSNAKSLLDHYTSGFSLAESYYAALPALNWQNIIIGDPLCTPYAQRPAVTIDAGTNHSLKGITPIRITAASQMRGATISKLDVYLDDRFAQTLYQPEHTRIVLRVGEHVMTYDMPRDATLRTLLEGLANAINTDADLSGSDGVRAVVSLNTSTLQLLARTSGEEGNDTPVSISVPPDEKNAPRVTARMDHDLLTGGGLAPTAAHATISFVARRIKPGDKVTLQIQTEKLSYTVPEGKATISDLLDALDTLVETSPALNTSRGVRATRDANGMPFITLEARTPGESGNSIPFQLSVQPAEGSLLRGYPDTPSVLSGGHGGSAASLNIQFALGESTVQTTYLLKAGELADGYHHLRVVAYDGSPAQVQGSGDCAFYVENNPTSPVITLPEKIGPVCAEVTVPVVTLANVKRVDLFVDGQLVGSGNAAPFAIHIPLTNFGRGIHDLWAEGFDMEGSSFTAAPIPLEVQVPPEVVRITPDHTGLTGATTHRIIGSGFLPECTVTLAGVPAHSVKFITPNILEVVSDAGPARQGSVEVMNPDHTVSALTTRFEYYLPTVAKIQIIPPQDVLAPGVKAQFSAKCIDQYGHPIQANVDWEAVTGNITTAGIFTAPETVGQCTIRASHTECRQVAEIPVTIGPEEVRDGRLRQWLIVGPFPDPEHTGLEKPLLDEATLAPSHGEQANGFTWQSLSSTKDFINLAAHFTPNVDVLAYGHLYLYAPAPTPCTLVFGSDDGIRIWLNGALVYALHISRPADPNQNTQAVMLQQGWNRLLVKNDQETGDWGFFMRLQTPDGKPLTGIKYQLDKPADKQGEG